MTVAIVNRQRTKKVNARQLKQIANALLAELEVTEAELGVTLVGATEMTRLNETFLQHEGSTDVITFDHADKVGQASRLPGERASASRKRNLASQGLGRRDACPTLHGELFICVDDAILQAHQFKTTWQSEIIRYLIHGVLHLRGHDDLHPAARRRMKREENRLLRRLAKAFPLVRLAR